MSDHDQKPLRWHKAASLADFTFYEPSAGSDRWAGGFAADGSHVEVIALVDGHEVSVDSSRHDRTAPDVVTRLVVAELLWRHALEEGVPLALPYSVTVQAEARSITIDGEGHAIDGIRIDGDARWVGTMRIGDVIVKIKTTSPAELSLRGCTDPSSLAEFPSNTH